MRSQSRSPFGSVGASRLVSQTAGVIAVAVGCMVLIGWTLNVEALKSVIPGMVTMKANTAFCFILTGSSLLLAGRGGPTARAGPGGLAMVIALISTVEYLTGLDFGIDELVFSDPFSRSIHLPPGRMALATGLAFILTSTSLVLLAYHRFLVTAQYLTFAAVLIPLSSLLAYLFGDRGLTVSSPYTSLALHTAATFAVLGAGILSRCSAAGPMAVFFARDAGGTTLRRLMPATILTTLLLGFFAFLGANAGLYSFSAGMILFAVLASVALALVTWLNAWSLGRSDAKRHRAEQWFQSTLRSIGDAVIATDGQGRVIFLNPVAEMLTGWSSGEATRLPLAGVFRIVNETTRMPAADPVDSVLRTGHVVGLANHTILIGRDGTERPIEDSAAPIKDEEGRVTGVVLVFHDATEKRESERALAASEEINRRIIASSPDCLKVMDLEGRLVSINANGCDLMEIDEVAVYLGREWAEFWPEEYRQALRASVAAARDGQIAAFHGFCPTARGTEKWWDVSVSPVLDVDGRPVQILAVSRDATDRVRGEAALREGEERLRLIMENVSDHAIFTMCVEGRVTDWNAGAERVFGHGREIIGQPASILFTPEDRAIGRPETEMHLSRTEGRACDNRWHIKKDGSRFYASGSMESLRGEEGTLRGFVKVVKDQTEQKRSEDARERHARQLHKLAEVSARINAAHDVNSIIGLVTKEARELIGASQAATSMVLNPNDPQLLNVIATARNPTVRQVSAGIDGRDLYEVVPSEDTPVRLGQAELTADPRWTTLKQIALVTPGENGWLAAPLVGRDGRRIGLLQLADKEGDAFNEDDEAILLQLSRLATIAVENARLYEELRSNDRRKDEFLAMLAHELRNPLAAISNAVHLSARSESKEHQKWSREVISRQIVHLTRLIDDLMDVSRISRGKIELKKDVLDSTFILDSAVATVRPLADERKHTMEVAIDRGNLWVEADPTRLEQVVVNLLHNAAKYSENAGHIRLSARLEGGEVVIAIRDQGVGIPPEKLPLMFELFAQGDRTLARSEGGLGIGLTVVKQLIEMHGGSVAASSAGHDQGSEFTLRLPAAERPASARTRVVERAAGEGRKARILVVDDNLDTARGMARLLKLLGHEIFVAHSGPEALEVAREHAPEFVLLDIGLPGMDGYEVASRLRQEKCCEGAVIIAVSGYGQDEDRRRSKEAGFDHHLIKPLDHDALLSLLACEAQ